MTRPTKEQVAAAMEEVWDKYEMTDWAEEKSSVPSCEQILEAEVRALRAELQIQEKEVDQLRALRMLALAYKRDFEENHTDAIASRYELFEALD